MNTMSKTRIGGRQKMKHIFDICAIKWIDIRTWTNDKKDRFTEPCIAYTFGLHYCNYTHEGVEIMRIVSTIYKDEDMETEPTDDFIDIPVGCIISIDKLIKFDIHKKKK